MAANIDIDLRRNEKKGFAWGLRDGTGAAYDITGWTVQMQIKSRLDNSTVIYSAVCAIFDGPGGIFTTLLDASEGSALNAYGDPIQTENLPYDIRLTSPAGLKIDFAWGNVRLARGVTQNV